MNLSRRNALKLIALGVGASFVKAAAEPSRNLPLLSNVWRMVVSQKPRLRVAIYSLLDEEFEVNLWHTWSSFRWFNRSPRRFHKSSVMIGEGCYESFARQLESEHHSGELEWLSMRVPPNSPLWKYELARSFDIKIYHSPCEVEVVTEDDEGMLKWTCLNDLNRERVLAIQRECSAGSLCKCEGTS